MIIENVYTIKESELDELMSDMFVLSQVHPEAVKNTMKKFKELKERCIERRTNDKKRD